MKMGKWIKGLFSKKESCERVRKGDDIEALRGAFKARYHSFKLLLNANNEALEIMTELEEALRASHPFGMSFVRSRITAISTNVFKIIKHLDELAPHKYEELFHRFREIQQRIHTLIGQGPLPREGPLVASFEEVAMGMADLVGPKAASLGEIRKNLGLRIPDGFVVTASGYHLFMLHNDLETEIQRRIQAAGARDLDQLYALSASIQQLIINATLPTRLEAEIRKYYSILESKEGKEVHVAMRSSATAEDLPSVTFAGQYRSELNVSPENIFQAYKEIVASKYSLQAMAYRFNRGIRDEDVAMCVICMPMVDPVSGGVMYSKNPAGQNTVVINSVWGLPKAVVDGSTPSDLFVILRDEPIKIQRKQIARKNHKFVPHPQEGIVRMELTEDEASRPSLTEEKALELARIALRLENYYGTPQDIEWAIDSKGSIILLQCRPLQQVNSREEEGTELKEMRSPIILKGGVTASPGAAAGPVFQVKKNMDMLQFPDGAVLVVAQALPAWAPLLSRAAAVVAELGGITGHLATVAREFGVPALFGVTNAMKALKDQDMVTVDADNRRVYKGTVEELIKRQEPLPNIMEGSPIYECLKNAARFIIPLNLLDPDAPDFSPKYCRTFHDITRFCHEKAEIEMFRFGKDHDFPERSAKQLYCDVPMQFWIINLDDGFKQEVTERWIRLEDICSIPMLALWQGMTAVPWEGPPPVDSRGFMSVLFEATQNPALDPATRASYGVRNYFMISRNFCSLQSRFGFHFSTVEALVGERASENYISFQFKGGAADLKRRIFRAQFISEILDHYGFRTELREDALFARLEGYEQSFMEHRLRILGYLIIHTRQLDMVMANGASVGEQREKMMKDLRDIVAYN